MSHRGPCGDGAQMEAAAIAPDLISYTKAVRSCWFAQQPEQADALVRQMQAAGHAPDARFYHVAITA
eukprot:2374019-Prymnesium_polylepis.2